MSTGRLTIDLDAVVANWRALDAMTNCKTAAVIKANGYGLGSVTVAKALFKAGVRQFFVAVAEEAAMFNRINTSNVRPGNLFDHCGISIPIIEPASNLPAGFQLMSGSLSEHELLNLSCRVERVFKENRLSYSVEPIQSP